MKIVVDSFEYKCWHEVGHATVCLHLGGNVDCIELLDDDARGHARARCVVTSDIERSVACGGFAVEFYLLDKGYAAQAPDDKRDINQVVLNNASMDGHAFFGREYSSEGFDEAETREFMNHAIGPDGRGGVVPRARPRDRRPQWPARPRLASAVDWHPGRHPALPYGPGAAE